MHFEYFNMYDLFTNQLIVNNYYIFNITYIYKNYFKYITLCGYNHLQVCNMSVRALNSIN